MKTLKFLLFFIIGTLVFIPSHGYSCTDIGSCMNEFVQANGATISVTQGGEYSGKKGKYFVGGGFQYQNRVMTQPAISFTPPTLSAGCSGIDFNLGSIGIPSASEFTQFLQSVGQAAPGYAFKLALNTLAPSVEAILSDIQSFTGSINNMMKNSCAAAQAVLDGVKEGKNPLSLDSITGEGTAGGKIARCSKYLIGSGARSDVTSADKDCQAYATAGNLFTGAKKQEVDGNINYMWEALKKTTYTTPQREMIMSLTGVRGMNQHKEASFLGVDLDMYICGKEECGNADPEVTNDVTLTLLTCNGQYTYCAGTDIGYTSVTMPSLTKQIYTKYIAVYNAVKNRTTLSPTSIDIPLGDYGRQLSRGIFIMSKKPEIGGSEAQNYIKAYSQYIAATITYHNMVRLAAAYKPLVESQVTSTYVDDRVNYAGKILERITKKIGGGSGKDSSELYKMFNESYVDAQKAKNIASARTSLTMLRATKR